MTVFYTDQQFFSNDIVSDPCIFDWLDDLYFLSISAGSEVLF
jgi:hypothetical protein